MTRHKRPYWIRNSEELSDYVARVEKAISRMYIDGAAALLGYRSMKDMLRKNPDGSSAPLCANKMRKAEGLERARKDGKYSGVDYSERIQGLAEKVIEYSRK